MESLKTFYLIKQLQFNYEFERFDEVEINMSHKKVLILDLDETLIHAESIEYIQKPFSI